MQLTAYGEISPHSSIWLGMKLTAILLLAVFLQVSAKGVSQGITLNVKHGSLQQVITEIEHQSGYRFLYTKAELDKAREINVNVSNVDLLTALTACFQEQPIQYGVIGNNIVLKIETPPATGALAGFFHIFRSTPPPGNFRGKVVNDQGRPLEDVSVMIKGGKRNVYTDKNGIFDLEGVTVGVTLEISYPGFTTVEYKVANMERPAALEKILPAGLKLYVVLQPSKEGLDEMQVIAYGKVSKRFNTGDVTTIKGEDIAKNPVTNVLEALQGRVPGMFITQASGTPGSNFVVQIRGQSSFGANAPLFVVDGVVYPANQALPMINPTLNNFNLADRFSSNLNGGNALNYLDPSLIESVDILKDADATSIYGSRGAYGVILITTKKGKAGIPRLTVNAYTGFNQKGISPKLVNTQQYLALRREAIKNDGLTPGSGDLDVNGTWDTTAYTNWDKELVGLGTISNISANYTGGIGGTSYLIGGNFTRQTSINKEGGAQNGGGINFSINTGSLNQKFNANLSGMFSTTVNDFLPVDYIGAAAGIAPNQPPFRLPNGKLDWANSINGNNPLANRNLIYHGVTNNLTATTTLNYTPLSGLTITARLGYNLITGKELSAIPGTSISPLIYTPTGNFAQGTLANYSRSTVDFDPVATYNARIGRGRLDLMAGMNMQSMQSYNTSMQGIGYAADAMVKNPSLGKTVNSSYSTTPNRQLGYFARIYYLLMQKYIIDLNGRYDGSTKFGPGKQFGTFGSVGLGWIFSEEPWIKQHLRFLSFGKLRGSYGTTGGDGVGDYAYLSYYTISNNSYQGGIRIVPNGLANPYLQWETNKKKEVALELHFLKERINLDVNYYDQRTSNQLVGMPLSIVTGFTRITQNSPALIQNRGLEMALNTTNIQSRNFSWKTHFNISINRNKLLAYPGAVPGQIIRQNPDYILGKSLSNHKVYKYKGVDPATGLYFFTNAKGETGSFLPFFTAGLNNDDRTVNVDMQPRYFGGFGNTISYKGFSLDFFFSFTKRTGLNYIGQQHYIPGALATVPTTEWMKRWQKPNDITAFPKVTTGLNSYIQQINFTQSSGAYEDATYARLQNVYLSYNFQPAFLKKAKIQALTVYLKGQNLLTISKYKPLDPENLAAGSTGPLRVYTGGLSITL